MNPAPALPPQTVAASAKTTDRDHRRRLWWTAALLLLAASCSWPLVRTFPETQICVLAQNIADACLPEHVLHRLSTAGGRLLDWKLTQAPYLFPDYLLVGLLAAVFGFGAASAGYPLLSAILLIAAWAGYFSRSRAAPAAVAALLLILLGFLYFPNDRDSPARTYIYLFLPGHHGGFALVAPAVFFALARCLAASSGPIGRPLVTFVLLTGLAILGDALAVLMYLLPAFVLTCLLLLERRITARRAGLLFGGTAAAYGIGQFYQSLAVFPTAREYLSSRILTKLLAPAAAMQQSVPTFLEDCRCYYFDTGESGIWFLLPVVGWVLSAGIVGRAVVQKGRTTLDDLLVVVPATSLCLGLPATLLLQLFTVGYQSPALSRQFVAFLLLGIVLALLVAGRLLARVYENTSHRRGPIDRATVAVVLVAAIAFQRATTDDLITRRTVWHTIPDEADLVYEMAHEAGVSRLMTDYWLAMPTSLRHPDLEVDFYISDMHSMEPRVRDPSLYPRGGIEAYVVDPRGLPKAKLVERFGPPSLAASRRTAAGRTVELLVFEGDKPRGYNQWLTSYSPDIYGSRAFFPASTLTHLLPPQWPLASYRIKPPADVGVVRCVHSLVPLWPGRFDHVHLFSGNVKPTRILVTLIHDGVRLLEQAEVAVDPASGEARVRLPEARLPKPWLYGELLVDIPSDGPLGEGEAFVYEGLTIERQ